jgi:uncharacterized membrane protein YgcG
MANKKARMSIRARISSWFTHNYVTAIDDITKETIGDIKSLEEFEKFKEKNILDIKRNKIVFQINAKANDPKEYRKKMHGFRDPARQLTKSNLKVVPKKEMKEKYGIHIFDTTPAKTKTLEKLYLEKDMLLKEADDAKLAEIAYRKSPQLTTKLYHKIGISQYSSDEEKAKAIRDYVNTMDKATASANNKTNLHKSRILFAIANNENSDFKKEEYGRKAWELLEKTLGQDKITQSDVNAANKELVDTMYGKKGTKERFIFDSIKSDAKLRTDEETIKFLRTEDGKQMMANITAEMYRKKKWTKRAADNVIDRYNLRKIEPRTIDIDEGLTKTQQKNLIGKTWLGLSGRTQGNPMVNYLYEREVLKNPELLKAAEQGDEEKLWEMKPTSVDYMDIRDFLGGEPKGSKRRLKSLKEHGIEIDNAPPDIQDYLDGVKEKKEKIKKDKLFGGSSSSKSSSKSSGASSSGSSSKSSYSSSGGGGKTSYAKGGNLFMPETEVAYRGGKAVIKKKRSKAGQWVHDKSSVLSKAERERKRKKEINDRFEELKRDNEYKHLTNEQKYYIAKREKDLTFGGPGRLKRKAEKISYDETERAKYFAKIEEKKGDAEARLIAAQKRSQRKAKAAKSPFWKVWYFLSNNIFVLVGLFLLISLLFLPIGLFYVLGWAIAVGMVSLVMFVIWVFMEMWFMIAQVIVALIGTIGQGITGLFNFIGVKVAGAVGMTFNQFNFQWMQDLELVGRNPETGERELLGMSWGQWNLVPPDFMKLNEFMPREFDTDVLIVKLWPALRSFFNWYTQPIADRYTNWIATAEWWYVGAIIGIPIVLAIIGLILAVGYFRRKMI